MDAQCFTDPNSTLMASSCDDMASPAPHGPGAARGADEAKSSQLLVIRVELRSVKHHTAEVGYNNGSEVLCRSKIDDAGAEISHHYYFSDGGHDPPYLRFPPRVVPFDEISVYRSDPRHVTKLMSRRDGLDVVIAVGTRGCDGF